MGVHCRHEHALEIVVRHRRTGDHAKVAVDIFHWFRKIGFSGQSRLEIFLVRNAFAV